MKKKRIIILIVIIIATAFLLNYILTYLLFKNNLETKAESFLKAYNEQALQIINLKQKETIENVKSDIKVANFLFYTKYNLIQTEKNLSCSALNQITKKMHKVSVKQWLLNGIQLQKNYTFVDELKSMIGGTVTIFQKIDEGFLRISTNVLKEDSSRAVGTFIPNNSPVIQTILKGETYIGRAYVVNDWYQTAYEPIYINGEIEGILYVGVKEVDFDNLKNILSSIRVGETGYLYVIDKYSRAIIHPTHQGEDLSQEEFTLKILAKKNGMIKYTFEGISKFASVRYFIPFNWYVAITIDEDELLKDTLVSIQIFTISISLILATIIVLVIARVFHSYDRVISHKSKLLGIKNKELEKTNHMKNKFFSIIAHDLKNPLGAFKESARLLHNDYFEMEEEEKIQFIEAISKTADNIYELLENLLDWSRSQRGHIKYCPIEDDITKFIQKEIDIFQPIANEKNIHLVLKSEYDTIAYFDVEMITTVIRNLIANAIKFSFEGSEILLSTTIDGTLVVVSVQDSGVGIKEEDKKKLFRLDSKHTTPGTNKEPGTGLGLILCKEFMDKHAQKIWVESESGKGSSFNFTLPMINKED